MAIVESTDAARKTVGQDTAGWPKIVLWTVLFQIAWFWREIPDLVMQGTMPDTDDFQRLTQIRNWLAGQPWYDLTNYRMDPPLGAEMHWSRLVDVPVAILIRFFDLFLDDVVAERAAAIVWPLLLLVATVIVIVSICRRLDRAVNPLLVVLFTVTCFAALPEFRPGRIDHHSIQILLFCAMLLGLVNLRSRWGPWLVGGCITASLSVGLESILLIVFVLAWIGLCWVLSRPHAARFMARTGLAIMVTLPLFMAANLPFSQWALPRCDVLSSVYFTAFAIIGATFMILPRLVATAGAIAPDNLVVRAGAGVTCAGLAAVALHTLFPECASGPYGALSDELASRWLVNVSEARGLLALVETTPQMAVSAVAYGLVLMGVSAFVLVRRHRNAPDYLALFAMLTISFVVSFLQYRALRIGIFASIPFCVAFAAMSWEFLRSRLEPNRSAAMVAQTVVVAMLVSPTWLALGALLYPENRNAAEVDGVSETLAEPAWKTPDSYIFCNRDEQYSVLAALPPRHVMTDINSGAPALVFTRHTVVGGPYHRNGEAIFAMLDFFGTDMATARSIAIRRNISYVAYCEPLEPMTRADAESGSLAANIRTGRDPDWLERVSPAGERMHVFRVITGDR